MSVGLASRKLVCDEPAAGVVRLRISNEERRGALDHEILDSLAETVREVDARCLLVTGSGSVFSAGYDIGDLEGHEFEERAECLVAHPFHAAIDALEAYDYPVIAALNGHAIGGGLELAITCDIRLAASGIKLGMPPAKLGLVYSHTGLCRFLEACGAANTAELFYVGRTVDAARAREMGLVNQVLKPGQLEQYACEMAAEIAANAPISLAGKQEDRPRAARPRAGAPRGRGTRARGPARVVLFHRRLPRGRARLRREAPARVARDLAVAPATTVRTCFAT